MRTFLLVLILSLVLISTTAAQLVEWTQVDSAQNPFSSAGSGVLGNYFYCFGGVGNPAQAFNLTTEHWEQSTPALFGLNAFGNATTDSAIYLVCRHAGGGVYSNEVQKFTPNGGGPTGTWSIMSPYPIVTTCVAAAWDGGNYIYAAGGAPADYACKYDIAADSWTSIALMPGSRMQAGGAFVLGKFYVVGGLPVGAATLEYDPVNNSWTEKEPMPIWLYNVTWLTTFNDSLVFVVGGGGAPGYPITNAVQVYDLLTNMWILETPLPAVQGNNSVGFVPPDKIISAGSWQGGPSSGVTYRGTGFPSTLPLIDISLTPLNPPIQIPASGGSFSFNATLTNLLSFTSTFNAWIMVQLPNGNWYGPVLGPLTLTLPGSATITRMRSQSVPASAPSGDYWYEARVGLYSNYVCSSGGLIFTKLATGAGPLVSNWACNGESFSGEESPTLQPAGFELIAVSPNPFNLTTAISYRLSTNSHVSLKIYDTAGRLVRTLVESYQDAGTHEVNFDGSKLASGVYLVRLEAGEFTAVQKIVLLK